MRMSRLVLPVFLAVLWGADDAHAAYDSAAEKAIKNLEIIRVTPEGDDVPAAKQLVIQFNRAVVPVGKMERAASEIPVIITPALECEWRWINASALACNLADKNAMQASTKYSVEIKPGIAAEDGTQIAETYHHAFVTERADVRYKEFYQWKGPGLPIVRLTFNQAVDKDSLAKHVFFAVGADGATRVALNVRPDPRDRQAPMFLPVPGEPYAMVFKKGAAQKSDDDARKSGRGEARRVWLVEPPKSLPLDTHVVLRVEAGLLSAMGPEPSVAHDDVVAFDTYPAFTFLGVKCFDNAGEPITVGPDETPAAKCNPMQSVRLSFSAPVTREKIGAGLAFSPPVGGWRATAVSDDESGDAPEEAAESDDIGEEYRVSHTAGKSYEIFLPGGLKAAQEYTITARAERMNVFARLASWVKSWFGPVAPIDARDIFGRPLSVPVHAKFATDHRSPNFVLDYSSAVLEKNVDSEVPFFVNNLDSYSFSYNRLPLNGAMANQTFNKKVPAVKDVQFAVPLGVREMLDGKTGALYGTPDSSPNAPKADHGGLFAQVTPYQVHVKLGHFNTVVWVTDMANGLPVNGAKVSIYKDTLTLLRGSKTNTAQGMTDATGVTNLPGTQTLDPDLDITRRYPIEDERYFVRVEKDGDMALLPIAPAFAIDSYRSSGSEWIYPNTKHRFGHMRAWGTTAQGIYRAGDTIQYKIFVRGQDNKGFVPPPSAGYTLHIIDPMGNEVQSVPNVVLSAFGGYAGEFTVPETGSVGWYQFKLNADFTPANKKDKTAKKENEESEADDSEHETSEGPGEGDGEAVDSEDPYKKSWVPMRVLVSDFTPAAFHVSNQLNGDLFHAGEPVEVATHAEMHSGGPYTDASTRITAMLDSATFESKNQVAKDFQFDSFLNEDPSQQIFQKIDTVNNKGELTLNFPTGTPNVVYGKLMVESAVADDRGKYISGFSRADYVGVDRLVGLHSDQWLFATGKPATVKYIVVDDRGNPAAGTPVNLAVEYQQTTAARVKGAGNAYLTEYHSEWVAAGKCTGTSTKEAQSCNFTPAKAGVYRVIAKIKDTKGHEHATTLNNYATGGDFVVWDGEGDSSLTLIPESQHYKVGDTARYLVKNPYPGATALVTIERYGVIDHFVQKLEGSTPVIEVKVKPDYLPGFYLSVVVVSPRVEKPLGEGQVDLGKPTFRMGYVTVPVDDPYKEMAVTAVTDRAVYKPREKVSLKLHAEPRFKDKVEPIELTVAVLDEAVFDLVTGGKANYDPYKGFYKLENLDLRNYSLLLRLVGRQKFEKKGANPGGDGGADLSMRSVFKFVSYWNAELKTDAQGNASAEFEAPDNLTGWRVLAIATTPTDRFGLGDANFKVNRPTEVRPVMPNQVMEGDEFNAGFSVMNRTDKPRTLKVSVTAEGNIDTTKTPGEMTTSVTLEPYKRTTVFLPVKTTNVKNTRDVQAGELSFEVHAGDDLDQDGLRHAIKVEKRRNLDVGANYGTTMEDKIEEPVVYPKDMLPDAGSLSVVASPTVIGNVSGAFKYMRDYPYICWEQRLSKGVMAAQYKALKGYLPPDMEWADSESLPQKTLDDAAHFQTPSGGMAYFVARDEYADPYLSAYTAIAFNWMRKSGYAVPEQVETKLQAYLSNLLKNDAVPDFYSEGMTSTVRAVALAALAERGKADMRDLERYEPHVKKMGLFGKSYFLQAALAVKGGAKFAPATAKAILAMSNETGGKFTFNETWDDSYSRILASPLRENCAVLDAFTQYGETAEGGQLLGDVPFKLVRSITQGRGNRDHWENTQENMFCMNALIDFARVYENDVPAMHVTATIAGSDKPFGQTEFKDVRDPAVTFEQMNGPADIGQRKVVTIEREGTGRLYYATRLSYALPLELSKPSNAGIEITREYSVQRNGMWELLKAPLQIKRGELVRVDLYVSVPAARNFVVVDDRVAGGLEPVNRELATTSEVDARSGDFKAAGGAFWFKYSDWTDFGRSRWSFYHQEIRHNSVRFYSDYLSPGNYHLSYSAQAIATGSFNAMPARAEEMYDPDVYGKTQDSLLKVEEAAPVAAPKP